MDSSHDSSLAAQFPLRLLFLIVAVAAVLLAMVGPYYRNWNPAQRTEFLVTWCIALPLIAAMYVGIVVPRRKLQSLGGRLLLRLEHRTRLRFVWQGCIAAWLLLIFTLSWPAGPLWGHARATPGYGLLMPIVRGLTWGCQIGAFTPIFLIRTFAIELREKGVLHGKLIAWSDVHEYHWSAHNQNQLVLRTLHPRVVTTIPVPAHLRTQVAEALKQQVPSANSSH